MTICCTVIVIDVVVLPPLFEASIITDAVEYSALGEPDITPETAFRLRPVGRTPLDTE